MGRVSNPFAITIVSGATALATAAAAMSPGNWADFSIPDLDNAVFFGTSETGNPGILNGFGYELYEDPVHDRICFAGNAHTGGADMAGAGGFAVYDITAHQWDRENYTGNSVSGGAAPFIGHSYCHGTVNRSNGDYYFRNYNSTTIRRRVYGDTGSASWATFSTIGGSYANQVAGALAYFPEMNGGAGGLVFADVGGAKCSNSAMTSWSDATGASPTGLGFYQNFIAHNNAKVYFGGGNGSVKMYSVNASKVAAAAADTPIECGSSNAGVILAHPNGVDLMAFAAAAGGAHYKYNAAGDSWGANIGAHGLTRGNIWAGCTLRELGIFFFIEFPGSVGTPTCRLYKPA